MSVGHAELKERIRETGRALGFDVVGFGPAIATERTRFLRSWIARGFAGEMDYLARRLEERVDPQRVLPSAKTLIVVGLYVPGDVPVAASAAPATSAHAGAASSRGRVARYAGGDDYHDVLQDRLRGLEAATAALAGEPLASKSYVDTGPVSERAAAAAAGLGWIGKNSCLIHPALGSHLMLGVILSELELEPDEPEPDHCGTCRACLDVCPTDAFAEPYVLDATRCISYTTIEAKGPIPEPLRAGHGDHVFGCDLCQTVCPWNQSRPRTQPADPLGLRSRLAKRSEWQAPPLEWILRLDAEAFRAATRGTALRRTGWRGLLRNALVAAGNAADVSLREAIEPLTRCGDALLEEHARWALAKVDAKSAAEDTKQR